MLIVPRFYSSAAYLSDAYLSDAIYTQI